MLFSILASPSCGTTALRILGVLGNCCTPGFPSTLSMHAHPTPPEGATSRKPAVSSCFSAHMRQFPANAPPWRAHCIPTTCAHRFTSHTVMDAPRTPTLENKQCALRREMSIALHCASASQPKQTFHTISSLPFIRLGTLQGAKPTFFIIPTRIQTHEARISLAVTSYSVAVHILAKQCIATE
jgi:hypothetical protein